MDLVYEGDDGAYRVLLQRGTSAWNGIRDVKLLGIHPIEVARGTIDQLEVAVEMLSFFKRNPDGYLPTDTPIPHCGVGGLSTIEVRTAHQTLKVGLFAKCGVHPLMPLVHQIEDAAGIAARR